MNAAKTNIDPNVKIPPAVARLAAAADAAFHAVNGTAPAGAEVVAPPDAPPAAPPAAEATPPVTSEVMPPAAPAADAAPIDWKHRFDSMKGRYDAAQNDIRALSERVTSMGSLIATLQAAPPAAEATPHEMTAASLLTPEERGEYGEEFLNVVGKRALEQLSPEMAALKKELAALKGQVGNTAATTKENARNAMNTSLDEALPMWRQVNVAPEFLAWLRLPDLFSGAIRLELLKTAYEQNDTPRVLAFFNGFLAQEAALAPSEAEPDTAGATALEKVPLETFAAPGRAKTAAAPGAPVEKPTFTRAQISTFYAQSAAGKFRGREAEKDQIERAIFEAERDGRIR